MFNLSNILRSKVFANYSHMTISQVSSIVVSLTVYPIVIRALGADVYGVYVFGLAIMSYLNVFIDFGMSTPLVKSFVDCKGESASENRLFSAVCATKLTVYIGMYLLLACAVAFVPLLGENGAVYLLIVLQGLSEVISFQWVYHAKQKMHVVTYATVGGRLLTIPFILLYVNDSSDLLLFVMFNAIFLNLGSLVVLCHLFFVERLRLVRFTYADVRQIFRDSLPFLSSDVIGSLRNEVAVLFFGAFVGMREIAIYDLANKVVSIPRTFIMNVNKALYPDVISTSKYDVRRLIRYEYLLGLIVIGGVALVSYWAVLLLGGESMTDAYGVSVVLSVSILTWLVVGAYLNFVFVPTRNYKLVTIKQMVAVGGFVVLCVPLVWMFGNVYAFAISFVASELLEMLYCHYIARRKGLF